MKSQNNNCENIGDKIKKIRAKKGLTQDALARKAELPYTTLTKIESGVLLEIKNEFPYLIEKSFSIKKNQKFEDIKNNNKDKNLFLYENNFKIFKIIQKHFRENEKLIDLNLKDTFLNLEITIPKENIEFIVNKTRASFDTTEYLRSLYSNIDKTFEINFNDI